MYLWTAFTIGILGSLHCVGMCGPIAMALPYQGASRWSTARNALVYNFGRIATYMVLGSIFGLLGKGVFLAGYQSALSIGLGVLLLVVALFSINVEQRLLRLPLLRRGIQQLQASLGKLLRVQANPSFFSIGLLNGLLPCGLVYMAIVGAVSTGDVLRGLAYMGLFGLGTLPLMLAASLAGNWVSLSLRNRLRSLIPVFLFAIALLFIYRGLQFDLPRGILFWEDAQQVPMCH